MQGQAVQGPVCNTLRILGIALDVSIMVTFSGYQDIGKSIFASIINVFQSLNTKQMKCIDELQVNKALYS